MQNSKALLLWDRRENVEKAKSFGKKGEEGAQVLRVRFFLSFLKKQPNFTPTPFLLFNLRCKTREKLSYTLLTPYTLHFRCNFASTKIKVTV